MNVSALLSHAFAPVEQQYGAREVATFALGVGFGSDPVDLQQLAFVHGPELQVPGSLGLVLANPGFWQAQAWTGIDWAACLLGEQELEQHRPLPPEAAVIGQLRVTAIVDKGPAIGALLTSERTLRCARSGEALVTLRMTTVCRGDGGFAASLPADLVARAAAGQPMRRAPMTAAPPRAPDRQCVLPTLPQNALLFDPTGIVNPIHSWPPAARAAGHARPILHGICTMGFAHHGLIRLLADYDGAGIGWMSARFRQVVFPGESLRIDVWCETDRHEADLHFYQVVVVERDVVAVSGQARLRLADHSA